MPSEREQQRKMIYIRGLGEGLSEEVALKLKSEGYVIIHHATNDGKSTVSGRASAKALRWDMALHATKLEEEWVQ